MEEVEHRTRSRGGLHPNAAAQALHGRAANGQADAGAGLFRSVEPAKYAENVFEILGLNADAVIPNREYPAAAVSFGRDLNMRLAPRPVFDAIADQILEQLHQQDLDGIDGRKGLAFDQGAGLINH